MRGKKRYNGQMRTCEWCGESTIRKNAQAKYCSTRCRVAAHRAVFPNELTRRATWTRADGKRPITVDGAPASSTDPDTWTTYPAAKASRAGDGMGIMLGGGLGCYDLDQTTEEQARTFAATIPEPIVYAEHSLSGNGVHIFIAAQEGPGTRTRTIERYTRGRFIRTTGQRITL